MKLKVNGVERFIDRQTMTVEMLLEELSYHGKFLAVALNMECVPRSQYSTQELKENDEIEILSPQQGG